MDKGITCVVQYVHDRLVTKKVNFFNPLKKNKSKTFASMYQVEVKGKQKTEVIKADRKLLQRLLTASHAGRNVEIGTVLKHELSPVPLSLAKVGGTMNSTVKSELMNILTSDLGINVPEVLPNAPLKTCTLIDGHAVQALGRPKGCVTFGDYSNVFTRAVMKNFDANSKRVDVVFDRYIGTTSIKHSTRIKRTGKRRPVRRIISGPDVPLPQIWDQFISMDENKADLARFLSEELMSHAEKLSPEQEVVTGGGFENIIQ